MLIGYGVSYLFAIGVFRCAWGLAWFGFVFCACVVEFLGVVFLFEFCFPSLGYHNPQVLAVH